MRTQLGSPGRAGSTRALQVKHASHRSTAARAASDPASFDPDAKIVNSASGAAPDALRYPALDIEESQATTGEQPTLRVGAKDEDTEASCLCGPRADELPQPQPNKFNPVPLVATAASVPVIASWYTSNPATNPQATKDETIEEFFLIEEPSQTVGITLKANDDGSLPVDVDGGSVELTIELPDSLKASEEKEPEAIKQDTQVAEPPAVEPSAFQASEDVITTPNDDQTSDQATLKESEANTTEEAPIAPIEQASESKSEVTAVEQPVIELKEDNANAEALLAQPVPNMIDPLPPSIPISRTLQMGPSPQMALTTMHQGNTSAVMPVSVGQGNEAQGVYIAGDASARYPAFKLDSYRESQYTAPPALPNYMPIPGAQRSSNCDAIAPGNYAEPYVLPGNSQMNVTSAPDYSAYYNQPEQQYQSRGAPQMSPQGGEMLAPRQVVPETVPPPANPMPLAAPYSGQGNYRAPSPSEIDPWGLLEHQGAYGMSQGLLHIDGGGGGGTYGAFSYGPPSQGTQSYAAPPANTQEGYRAYGQSQGQIQQYYSQPPQQPQAYPQRGGGGQAYQGAPGEGYYYPPSGAAPPPAQARRPAPEPRYMAPPSQGQSYSYQASPAGAGAGMQDPYAYAGQYGGNQPYPSGNQPYSSGNQAYANGNPQAYASGNQPYSGNMPGNQSYGGNQSYAPAQYGNQAYAAPPSRGGNYAPPVEASAQGSYPGIELLSPGYPEYERGHKGAAQPKQSAPPPEAYYPGIDSTYSAYGMKAPTAPTSNPPPQQGYYGNPGGGQSQSYGYSAYTAPSNYQGPSQPGVGVTPQYGGYSQPAPPAVAPNSSYAQSYYYQQYYEQPGAYYGSQTQTAPSGRSWGRWPTSSSTEKREQVTAELEAPAAINSEKEQAATLVLPVDGAPDLNLPVAEVSGLVTTDVHAVQRTMKTQFALEKVPKLHQTHIPIATLPAPSHMDPVSEIAAFPSATLDLSLLAAAFCCMMAAKAGGVKDL